MINVTSTHRPAVFTLGGQLRLAGGTVVSVNGKTVAGWPVLPPGTQLSDIAWTPANIKTASSSEKTFTVEGSRGRTYTVTVAGGRVTCTCPGFGFRRTCKHAQAAQKG